MTLIILTPPAAEPVGVAEVKAHLRVSFNDEDALIGDLITAAREQVEAELGLCLIATSLREIGYGWPAFPDGSVALSRGPLIGVDAVHRIESDGSLSPLTCAAAEAGARPARITLAAGARPWAAPADPATPRLQVDYRAGFGAAASDVPETLRQAVLALAADAYDRRGAPSAPAASDIVETWLRSWRRLRL